MSSEIMIVNLTRLSTVKPAKPTPNCRLWCSNLDLVAPKKHTRSLYFYNTDTSSNINMDTLEESLSKSLVPFYPLAGRMGRDPNGRLEVNCNGQGVLFIEADCSMTIADLGDLGPDVQFLKLTPKVEYGDDIASCPLFLVQVTQFKCGGVAIGVSFLPKVADRPLIFSFIKFWSDLARGLTVSIHPFIDRTLIRARNPPTPSFPHLEYSQSSPRQISDRNIKLKTFNLPQEFINRLPHLKSLGKSRYTTFVLLAAHAWRVASIAREIPHDMKMSLYVGAGGRRRFEPPLPDLYLGDAISQGMVTAVLSRVLENAEDLIHEAIARLDDQYLRSAIDFLELEEEKEMLARGPDTWVWPNMAITTWVNMPNLDADFGWGLPTRVVPLAVEEGLMFLLPAHNVFEDGGMSLSITLYAEHMRRFEDLLYQI